MDGEFSLGGLLGFVAGALMVLLVGVSSSHAECHEVIRCIDTGTDREICDQLFPQCKTT